MKRGRLLITTIILFIGINVLLVYFDDNGTVERKSYVSEWSEVFKTNLYEKMNKAGVLTSTAANDVYFDKSLGNFQEFLIEEGAEVNQGDQLYTYRVNDYYDTKAYLTNEMSRINGEVTAIETAISEISNYQIPRVQVPRISPDGTDEENSDIIVPSPPPIEAEYMQEQYLIEKEKELARARAQLESVQSQLTELEAGGDSITVVSPYQGKATVVSKALDDPIITISSTTLHVIGELTEQERTVIKNDMPVEVTINESNSTLKGSVTSISDLPKEVELHDNSEYPFSVSFEEGAEVESLLPGYHANLTITTKQSKGATALFEDAIFGNSIWKMTSNGKLHVQKVETGLEMASMQEIIKGAKVGEWIAKEPESEFRSGATFVTPLKFSEVPWSDTFNYDKKNWSKYVVMGILSR
ncbi:efflux RND transporter periplasmic adaptor subunit [Virgibacillus necropolis]|uniref:HlyD family secretion protein n=1 Tax=Virgibacillus necropolis TaxID=163877 RepID=A0A221M7L9_9BACI|nr:efflux RND transporter periplasmic adaptor subunit [Virgibacillus necropolis]ASN03646.1 HlyD family secretion protein [Virgibacillus necropolis]